MNEKINVNESLFYPFLKRQALSAFIGVSALFITDQYPFYGIVIGIFFLIMVLQFPKSIQKVMLFFFVLAFIVLLGHRFFSETISFEEPSKNKGMGFVETLLPRSSGVAVIINENGKRFRLTHKNKEVPAPLPGDSIAFEAKWYPVIPPTIPGTFDTEAWLRSQKFAGYGELTAFAVTESKWIPERSFYAFRLWLLSRFTPYASPAECGLLLGLLAGDRSGIPEALQNDFRRTGLVHVLAISGFHVVLLSEILLLILKAFRLPHTIASIVAMILLLVYVPVTGGSSPVSRSVLMFVVIQSGTLFQKKADSLNSLGFALLLLVLYNPEELWNPGFQLSAAATAGIIIGQMFSPFSKSQREQKKHPLWNVLKQYLIEPSYITLTATLATAPFLIYHFQSLSPVAWLGNLFIVPLVSFGMQAGLFALLVPIPFVEASLVESAAFFLRLASYLTNLLSGSPNASMTVGPYPTAFLCLFTVLLLLSPVFFKKKSARHCFLSLSILAGILFITTSITGKINPSWKVTILDAGQADCIVIQSPAKRTYVIDTGVEKKRNPATEKIIPYLRNQGIQTIEAVIITHADADHFGGAAVLFKSFPVKALWLSECTRIEPKPTWQKAISTALDQNIIIKDIKRGDLIREEIPRFLFNPVSYFEMKVLHPSPLHCAETNTESLTLRVEGLGHSILLTGDLTLEGEKEILNTDISLQSDLLKVGHHGSKTSSHVDFLEAVKPKYAFISAGKNNRFRHPSRVVTNRLDSLKIPFKNTAEAGSFFIEFMENDYTIESSLNKTIIP